MNTLIAEFDLFKEYDNLKQYIIENPDEYDVDIANEEALNEYINDYMDSDYIDSIYEYVCDSLDEELNKFKTNKYICEVNNFGWQKLTFKEVIDANNGRELLEKILPKTENFFTIYLTDENKLIINNRHHDSPYGDENYIVYPYYLNIKEDVTND